MERDYYSISHTNRQELAFQVQATSIDEILRKYGVATNA